MKPKGILQRGRSSFGGEIFKGEISTPKPTPRPISLQLERASFCAQNKKKKYKEKENEAHGNTTTWALIVLGGNFQRRNFHPKTYARTPYANGVRSGRAASGSAAHGREARQGVLSSIKFFKDCEMSVQKFKGVLKEKEKHCMSGRQQ